MSMQPASFATQVMDIVELRHHETVKIVMDPNSLWEVRDVDADYKGVEYNGRRSDIHTYHQLHIGHGFSLLMAHQGYHAPQMTEVNGIGRYNLIWEAGTSYPEFGYFPANYPIPDDKFNLAAPDALVIDESDSHDFLNYYAESFRVQSVNELRRQFNEHTNNEHISRGNRPGPYQPNTYHNRYGSMVLLEGLESEVPWGVTEMYVIPHPEPDRSQGIIFSYLNLPQMHKDIDRGILVMNADGLPVWSENG